jgi:hypothetical protein
VLLGVLQAVMNRATFEKQFHKISDGVNFLWILCITKYPAILYALDIYDEFID